MNLSILSRLSTMSAILVLVSATHASAGPEGRYTLVGTNPGGSGQYTGTVRVVAHPNVYEVNWKIGKSRYNGIGMLNGKHFSVAYYGSNLTGIAVYTEQSDGSWKGEWAVRGSTHLGTENWVPR